MSQPDKNLTREGEDEEAVPPRSPFVRSSYERQEEGVDRERRPNSSNGEFIPDLNGHVRRPVWVHPTSGYLNVEKFLPSTHPFVQQQHLMRHRRGGTAFTYVPPTESVSAPSYMNSFPRRGIGPSRPQMYFQPYTDRTYMYQQQPSHQHIRQQSSGRARTHQNLYNAGYDLSPFNHHREAPLRSQSGPILNFKAADEAINLMSATSVSPMVTDDNGGTSTSTNEGSSEAESVETPVEQPVGTTPILHPLPNMFNPLPRPLSFPVSSRNKELPALALFQNCSLESKVIGDYADSHQELSLMLALPGLSAHQAPLLSLQQAGDILQTINNPLVVLKVGRLARKLVPDPALLNKTGDVGTLALWLSPTSDVRLFWHSFLDGPRSDSARAVEEQIAQLRSQGEGSPYKELFSHVELSEELAWVAAESDQVDGGSGIRLEMIKHDPSGRSFKLTRKKGHDRQKIELATKLATEEGKTGQQVTEENQKLRQLLAQCMSEDSEEEDTYFFWIAESSVSEGMQMLNTMQNRLDHLPTLSGESGVPEKKLEELYAWFSKGQKAASGNSTLSNEIASWIDLRSGASVPSQLFSNTCPATVPNWTEAQQPPSEDTPSTSANTQSSVSEDSQVAENTIREGCALSATANFLVADKKWGLTHLATASVMVAVGVESTGFFYDEAKAHLDLSHCAHELAKKRAEAGASAEAERLGRIRLEELVAVKSLNEMRSNKAVAKTPPPSQRAETRNVSPQSEELIQQQRAMLQSLHEQRRPSEQMYNSWGSKHVVPGHSIQGNSVLHHSHVQAHADVVTMPEYFRQHVHYGAPADHQPSFYQSWKHDHGEAGGNTQVMAPYQQYEHPSWSVPNTFHPYPWPYGDSVSPPPVYQPTFVPASPPMPSFFPRHLPPQLPFLQLAQLQNSRRHKTPNMSLVRIAQEAREKVTRDPRERVRAGPSGSNLAATNIDINQDGDDVAYAWHDPAHQLGSLYRNSSLNVARMPDGESVNETRAHAETPKNTTADDTDKM